MKGKEIQRDSNLHFIKKKKANGFEFICIYQPSVLLHFYEKSIVEKEINTICLKIFIVLLLIHCMRIMENISSYYCLAVPMRCYPLLLHLLKKKKRQKNCCLEVDFFFVLFFLSQTFNQCFSFILLSVKTISI